MPRVPFQSDKTAINKVLRLMNPLDVQIAMLMNESKRVDSF